METKPITYSSPSLMKIKTTKDKKEHYINTSMIVSFSPSNKEDETDIILINGKTYTIKGTPVHNAESYRQDVKEGSCMLNLIR